MKNFRSKPVIVEAIQFTGFKGNYDVIDKDLAIFLETAVVCAEGKGLVIITSYDIFNVFEGDWIIKHDNGKFEVMNDAKFNFKYEDYVEDPYWTSDPEKSLFRRSKFSD